MTARVTPWHRPHAVLTLRGRTPLAFADLHGEPLYLHALRSLVAALTDPDAEVAVDVDEADADRVGREVRDLPVRLTDGWWQAVRRTPGRGLLAVDPLCPLVTADFITSLLADAAADPDGSVVAVRPVTDTLKAADGDRILGTVDRERLVTITSPVLVSPAVLRAAAATGRSGDRPPLEDFAALVTWLRARGEVRFVRAPSLGRRVETANAVHLLEHVDRVGHRVRVEAGRPAKPGRGRRSGAEDRP